MLGNKKTFPKLYVPFCLAKLNRTLWEQYDGSQIEIIESLRKFGLDGCVLIGRIYNLLEFAHQR